MGRLQSEQDNAILASTICAVAFDDVRIVEARTAFFYSDCNLTMGKQRSFNATVHIVEARAAFFWSNCNFPMRKHQSAK